jgi:membrane associated rhomboid family serine protease
LEGIILLFFFLRIFDRFSAGFAVKFADFKNGRYFLAVLSAFIHRNWLHMLTNVYGFYLYAPILYQLLGAHSFILFYLTSAAATILCSVLYKRLIGSNEASLGSSGSLAAVKMLAILLNKDAIVKNGLQLFLSHLLMDYIFLGDYLDVSQIVSGMVCSFAYYTHYF